MTSEPAGIPQSFWSQFLIWASRVGLAGKLAVALAVAAIGALPPGMPGYDPDLQGYYYYPVKAKRLLAEAGYPDGAGFPEVRRTTADLRRPLPGPQDPAERSRS